MRGLFYGIGHKPNSGAKAAALATAFATLGTYGLLRLLLRPAAIQVRALLAWPCPLHPPKPHPRKPCTLSLPHHNLYADFLAGQIALDKEGYVVVQHGGRTSVEGVFAAGDLHDVEWRQVGASTGAGLLPWAWECGRQAARGWGGAGWVVYPQGVAAAVWPLAWECS